MLPSLLHLAPNEKAAITEYIARIRERFPDQIQSVVLFGSKARGDDDAESDIDLLILVVKESKSLRTELWHIASDVSLEYTVVLSPRVYGQKRWAETRYTLPPLYRAIINEGLPLTEKVPAEFSAAVTKN